MKAPSPAELEAMRRLRKAVESDTFFADWWTGMDDVVYEDEHARDAVESFRAALLEHARFPEEKSRADPVTPRIPGLADDPGYGCPGLKKGF